MTDLILLRHTESKYNVAGKLTGSGSNPRLTPKGFGQAGQAGINIFYQYGTKFDFMVVSGLTRTNQTAAAVNEFLGINNVSYNNKLQERNYGIYEGCELKECWPVVSSLSYNESIPDGESKAIFVNRVVKALCAYLQGEESLGLVVTHGHVVREAIKYFLGRDEYVQNGAFVELNIEEITDFGGKCTMVSDDG